MIRVRIATEKDCVLISEVLFENQLIIESEPLSKNQCDHTVKDHLTNERFMVTFWDEDCLVGVCFHTLIYPNLVNCHTNVHKNYRGKGLLYKLKMMDYSVCKRLGYSIVSIVPESNVKIIKSNFKSGYVFAGHLPKTKNRDGNMISRIILFKE